MSAIEIWHNPRCGKSRKALALLEEKGASPNVVLYLQDPPDAHRLRAVLDLLGLQPRGLMRIKEPAYAELGLADQSKSEAELIAAMVAHPILIERPVAIRGKRACVGRPPENVLELLVD